MRFTLVSPAENASGRERHLLTALAIRAACVLPLSGLGLVALAPLPAAARAAMPLQVLTVVNSYHARPAALRRVERAIIAQSVQLHREWDTPIVRFGRGGWKVYPQWRTGVTGEYGYHSTRGDGVPYAVVGAYGQRWFSWSIGFSHEVLEMLVDPSTVSMPEICDPVERFHYLLDGVPLSEFVSPGYFGLVHVARGGWLGSLIQIVFPSRRPGAVPP